MLVCAEYIWLDGTKPEQQLRSKTKILPLSEKNNELVEFPQWNYDGSSTYQASGDKSDLVLKPINFIVDTMRGEGNYLVLCEVFDISDNPHNTNTRAILRTELDKGAKNHNPWIGFEQEYTLLQGNRPFGWPENGYPRPQGPYYCAVGTQNVFGREIVEAHTQACIEAGLMICGINAEVMPSQWEFQIGYRGVDTETPDLLTVCDHLWFARYLLHRICEEHEVVACFEQKPMKGDWNGAGCHSNFSTDSMRDKKNGWESIKNFITCLEKNHQEHIMLYGSGLSERLTGQHETCDINSFKSGECDRKASIRIPEHVVKNRCGYIEDRRPGANIDPYLVAARLMKTFVESVK